MKLRRGSALALLAVLMTATVAFGYWVVVYQWGVSLQPREPPIVFEAGSNANVPGIWGQTIGVSISANKTQATITLPVTYGTNRFKDILYIKNNDANNGYYVAIEVVSTVNDPFYGSITLTVINGTNTYNIDLLSTGVTQIGWIPANGQFTINIEVVGEDGQPLPSNPGTITLNLLYSGEQPVNP